MVEASSRYVSENISVLVIDDNRYMRQLVESIRDDGGNTGRALLIGLQKLIEKADAVAR